MVSCTAAEFSATNLAILHSEGPLSANIKSEPEPLVNRAQEVCESGGGRPGLPVPNSPYRLCGRRATYEEEKDEVVQPVLA